MRPEKGLSADVLEFMLSRIAAVEPYFGFRGLAGAGGSPAYTFRELAAGLSMPVTGALRRAVDLLTLREMLIVESTGEAKNAARTYRLNFRAVLTNGTPDGHELLAGALKVIDVQEIWVEHNGLEFALVPAFLMADFLQAIYELSLAP